jgi:excisionase family DNA binding protein
MCLEVKNKMQLKQHSVTTSNEESQLLTVPEFAQMLRISVATVRAWVMHRRVPFIKLGDKAIRFRRSDVEEMLASSFVAAKPRRLPKRMSAYNAVKS